MVTKPSPGGTRGGEVLSEQEIGQLLDRCARMRRRTIAFRALAVWSARCFPGLLAAAGALVVLRVHQLPWHHVVPVAGGWLLVAGLLARAPVARLSIPRWTFPARVDRLSGARGALMQRFADMGRAHQRTGGRKQRVADGPPVPRAALAVCLSPPVPAATLAGWGATALTYMACVYVPLPDARAPAARLTPIPVERAARLVERVEQAAPDEKAFVQHARRTLSVMESKSGGLDPADFDALERLSQRASRVLQGRATELRAQGRALADLDRRLAGAQAGVPESRAAFPGDDTARLRALMAQAGLDGQQQRAWLERLEREQPAGRQPACDPSDPGCHTGFDRQAVAALRRQLASLQAHNAEQLALAGAERGQDEPGVAGPGGSAPLRLNGTTELDSMGHVAQPFRARRDERTVILASGTTRQNEPSKQDVQGLSQRHFETGTSVQYWEKRVRPRHRAVLRNYFGDYNATNPIASP